MSRKEKRQLKALKRVEQSKKIIWTKRITTLGVITVALSFPVREILKTKEKYEATLTWSHHKEDPFTFAELPPDILTDADPISQEAKQNFIKLKSEMVKDGLLTDKATLEHVNQLESYIAQMTSYNELYTKELEPLKERVIIQTEWNGLFANQNTLKSQVTPDTVLEVMNKHFPKIKEMLIISYGQDPFAKQMLTSFELMTEDIKTLNDYTYLYSPFIKNVSDGVVTVYGNKYPKDTLLLVDQPQTHYVWRRNSRLFEIKHNIIKGVHENLNTLTVYTNYQEDLKQKEIAYSTYQSELQRRLDEIESLKQEIINKKERERLEKERQKELERRRKEEQKQKEENAKKEEEKKKDETTKKEETTENIVDDNKEQEETDKNQEEKEDEKQEEERS